MYYVSLILAIAAAFLAGRFCVSIAAKIDRRWLRRLVFWLVVFPGVSAFCLYTMASFGDDMVLVRWPRLFLGAFMPTTVFAFTFTISAFRGFKVNPDTQTRRACRWHDNQRLVVCTIALGASLIAYDWQLKNDLIHLKETTLAEWRNTPQEMIPDDQNAATEYLSLSEFRETLDAWDTKAQERFGTGGFGTDIDDPLFFNTIPNPESVKGESVLTPETLYVETDFSDDWFNGLQECEEAFLRLRDGAAKPRLTIIRSLDNPNNEKLNSQFDLLASTLKLFQLKLLTVASRGKLQQAYNDVDVLLTIARHFDSDIEIEGQRFGNFARSLAIDAIEHILYLAPKPPATFLKPLIENKHNPRYRLPESMKWGTARFITQMCDTHLGLMKPEEFDLPWNFNVMARFPSFLPSRLAMAGDDMALAQARSVIYQKFADGWADRRMTGDKLIEELGAHWPPLFVAGDDTRDTQLISANIRYDSQQSINLTVAAALYQIKTEEYPANVEQLIPEFLSAVPVSIRDGEDFSLHPFNSGLIISAPYDFDLAVKIVSNRDSTRFAEDLRYGSTLLGPAYRLAHIREPDTSPEVERPN